MLSIGPTAPYQPAPRALRRPGAAVLLAALLFALSLPGAAQDDDHDHRGPEQRDGPSFCAGQRNCVKVGDAGSRGTGVDAEGCACCKERCLQLPRQPDTRCAEVMAGGNPFAYDGGDDASMESRCTGTCQYLPARCDLAPCQEEAVAKETGCA
jgi:hypothetical protein